MQVVACLLLLTGAYPLWRAWVGNRRTSLRHAVGWAAAAWASWGAFMAVAWLAALPGWMETARYLALCLTACAVVAVLGARRPGVGAWNFVLLGLLGVMLLPLAERLVTGPQPPGVVRGLFLGATLAVGVLNYLPTRLAPAALLLALGCSAEMLVLLDAAEVREWLGELESAGWLALALVPWAGFLGWRRRPADGDFNRLWLDFRDRYGLLWGQRLREQFNRAAANAGWPVHLSWQGLQITPGAVLDAVTEGALTDTLRAMLKRFLSPDGEAPA